MHNLKIEFLTFWLKQTWSMTSQIWSRANFSLGAKPNLQFNQPKREIQDWEQEITVRGFFC